MKDPITYKVKQFLEEKIEEKKNILLGFSGGPDSLCLFHIVRQLIPSLHIAHVDHGWRKESEAECLRLKEEVERWGVPFHFCRLEGGCEGENAARQKRLEFFSFLYKQLDCEALLLGHQADDQAETVLKRVFEGASLFSLGGIREETTLYEMRILRPLLSVSKKDIYKWLEKNKLVPLEDPTNDNPMFLRSRLRTRLLPLLEESFGKSIRKNLHYIGETSLEWQGYLERKIAPYFSCLKRSSTQVEIDLTPFFPIEKIELHAFLKKWIEQEGAPLSREALHSLILILEKGNEKKQFISNEKIIDIERRIVAIKSKY